MAQNLQEGTTIIYDSMYRRIATIKSTVGDMFNLGNTLASYLAHRFVKENEVGNEDIVFQGAGCMAASIVAFLKQGPGEHFLVNNEEKADSPYIYSVKIKNDAPMLTVLHDGVLIFSGEPHEFVERRQVIGL